MPSGFRNSAGTDFDDVFDLFVQGDKGSATGYRSGDGNDLNQRYAPLLFGTKAPDVGYRDAAGSDLSNRWAKKDTAQYALAFNGKSYQSNRQALTNENTNITAGVSVSILANGTWSIAAMTGSPTSGTWLPAGRSVSEYTVQIATSGNSRATVSNNAPGYVAASSSAGATISATVRGQSLDVIDETISVTVYLRHTSGLVTTSHFAARVFVQGYL